MEITRHFTATTFVVFKNKTLLHKHRSLDMWLPPGGHIDRDELPHIAAAREVLEETGLEVDIVHREPTIFSENAPGQSSPWAHKVRCKDVRDGYRYFQNRGRYQQASGPTAVCRKARALKTKIRILR